MPQNITEASADASKAQKRWAAKISAVEKENQKLQVLSKQLEPLLEGSEAIAAAFSEVRKDLDASQKLEKLGNARKRVHEMEESKGPYAARALELSLKEWLKDDTKSVKFMRALEDNCETVRKYIHRQTKDDDDVSPKELLESVKFLRATSELVIKNLSDEKKGVADIYGNATTVVVNGGAITGKNKADMEKDLFCAGLHKRNKAKNHYGVAGEVGNFIEAVRQKRLDRQEPGAEAPEQDTSKPETRSPERWTR